MVVAYERTASNDALIGSLLVMSYVCATGKSIWRTISAGLIAGAIALVKPSVWALLPIAAAGVLEGDGFRNCAKRLAVFCGVALWAVSVIMIRFQSDGEGEH